MISYTKCQKVFKEPEIAVIKALTKRHYDNGRCRISREVCKELEWYGENGKPKEWVCRELLVQMSRDGVIDLPAPMPKAANRFLKKQAIAFLEPTVPFTGSLKDQGEVPIRRTQAGREQDLWDHLVKQYHYLGYAGHMGRFVKYIAWCEGYPIACLGWMGAALKVKSRDSYLGITDASRYEQIKGIANNFRFVILPWVQVKNLASHLLSRNAIQVRDDWRQLYGCELQYLETFVEQERFTGTCYQAANWKHLGETAGYAKTKQSYRKHQVIKDVYIYELLQSRRR